MAKSFAESIGKWASQTVERVDAVHARSFELLGEELAKTVREGGRVPFLTGNLARSLLASKSGMPNVKPGGDDGEGSFTANQSVGLVAATLKATDTVWVGYQANYARRRNYGFVGADSLGRVYNESGDYFVEGAIAEWPQIVARAVAEVKG